MSTVLVTGVGGFIGSHIAERLLERGDTVVGIDNMNDYYSVAFKDQNIALLERHSAFTFVRGDFCDFDLLESTFNRFAPNRIAHLGARAGVRPSIEDPFVYESANVRGTLNLLELSRRGGVENFVLTSSSSVYGNSKQVPFTEDDSATNTPISPYAATKKATEVMGYTFHHLYGLPINVIRPFTVYGPRGRPDMAPWLFTEAALRGTPIKKFGDGTTRRDYTFIGDFADGFVRAIDRTFGYEIFNLGNSATVSLNEMLEVVQDVTGKQLDIRQHPMQPGDVEMTYANIDKAKQKLGYHPSTPFREGMKVFHDWFITR